MKWIIYTLLLVNLGFGLWHYRSVNLENREAPTDDDNLRLVLLREHLAQQQERSTSSEAESTARCNTLGPFKSKKSANAIKAELLALGIKAERRTSKDNTRKGYWVLIPPEKSRKQARAHISELKEKNVKDYFLVVTGEQVNAVSLGVFSKSELAQRRYKEIKDLGFRVKLQKVDLPLREYWLDWPRDMQLLPEVLDAFRERHPNIGQTDRPC
jgi:cell division septation protein DedD